MSLFACLFYCMWALGCFHLLTIMDGGALKCMSVNFLNFFLLSFFYCFYASYVFLYLGIINRFTYIFLVTKIILS